MNTKKTYLLIFLLICLCVLFFLDLIFGSVSIPLKNVWQALAGHDSETNNQIVQNIRLPKAITAVLSGMALSVCGILMQTLFRNPLAGPYVLGVNSGASLGVAFAMLSASFYGLKISGFFADLRIVTAAVIGALTVMFLVMTVAKKIKNNTGLLLAGIMLGQMISSFQSLLEYFADPESLKSFVVWNMASISNTTFSDLILLAPLVSVLCLLSLLIMKRLDVLLLGEDYATSLGLNVKRLRLTIIIITGILSGVTTAFCGPIAFIGIAIPHLSRLLLKTSLHKYIIPASLLMGPCIMLVCDIICQLPPSGILLPLNVITSVIGAPVVLYLLLKNNKVIS